MASDTTSEDARRSAEDAMTFVGNASHKLRTPLTVNRAVLEVTGLASAFGR
jgi:signal transduction histidine kinase